MALRQPGLPASWVIEPGIGASAAWAGEATVSASAIAAVAKQRRARKARASLCKVPSSEHAAKRRKARHGSKDLARLRGGDRPQATRTPWHAPDADACMKRARPTAPGEARP